MSEPGKSSSVSDQYTLKFEERGEYLYAFVGEGKDSLEVSKDFWQRVCDEACRLQSGRVLIEEDLDGLISSTEVYDLAVFVTRLDFDNVRIAFVDRHLSHQDLNRFGELVATNRGMRTRVFNSVQDGENWLARD